MMRRVVDHAVSSVTVSKDSRGSSLSMGTAKDVTGPLLIPADRTSSIIGVRGKIVNRPLLPLRRDKPNRSR